MYCSINKYKMEEKINVVTVGLDMNCNLMLQKCIFVKSDDRCYVLSSGCKIYSSIDELGTDFLEDTKENRKFIRQRIKAKTF